MVPPPGAYRRLLKEIQTLQSRPPPEFRIQPGDDSDVLSLTAWIRGPSQTPFEGGYFAVGFNFNSCDFPAEPPKCRMLTKVFHPNIDTATGAICVSTLKLDWSPSYGILHILSVIRCLFISPNPDSALNPEAGKLLQEDYKEYEERGKLWTGVHACRKPEGIDWEEEEVQAGVLRPSGSGNLSSSSGTTLSKQKVEEPIRKDQAAGQEAGTTDGTSTSTMPVKVAATAKPTAVKKPPVKKGIKRL